MLIMAENVKKKLLYFILFSPLAIKHANTVITIFGFTSTKSSGRAYIQAPTFRATEIAYLGRKKGEKIITRQASFS